MTLERNEEYVCVSADATLKVCMALKGQASYTAKADLCNSACVGDSEALRRLLTVRGRTEAVLGLSRFETPPKGAYGKTRRNK